MTAREFTIGTYSSDLTSAAATAVADIVRYLNHATLHDTADEALPYPPDVARLIGSLHSALTRMPQLLTQLAERERALAADPRLGADNLGPMPAGGASALALQAATHLESAATALGEAVDWVRIAHHPANRLHLGGGRP